MLEPSRLELFEQEKKKKEESLALSQHCFFLFPFFSSSSNGKKNMASSSDPRKAYPNPQQVRADRAPALQKPPGGSEVR
jgi:hypothetical protein